MGKKGNMVAAMVVDSGSRQLETLKRGSRWPKAGKNNYGKGQMGRSSEGERTFEDRERRKDAAAAGDDGTTEWWWLRARCVGLSI